MHLIGAIAGGFLASLQFILLIRYKAILFHRMNGYLAATLLLIGNTGAYMIVRSPKNSFSSIYTASPPLQFFSPLLPNRLTKIC